MLGMLYATEYIILMLNGFIFRYMDIAMFAFKHFFIRAGELFALGLIHPAFNRFEYHVAQYNHNEYGE